MEFCDFPFHIWEFHHPNWRTHIFQRGGSTTSQIVMLWHLWHTHNYAIIVMAHDFYDIVEKYYFSCATCCWLILSKSVSTHESTSHHGPAARLTAWAMLRASRAATFTEKKSRRGTGCHRGFRLFAGETSCWRAMKNAATWHVFFTSQFLGWTWTKILSSNWDPYLEIFEWCKYANEPKTSQKRAY